MEQIEKTEENSLHLTTKDKTSLKVGKKVGSGDTADVYVVESDGSPGKKVLKVVRENNPKIRFMGLSEGGWYEEMSQRSKFTEAEFEALRCRYNTPTSSGKRRYPKPGELAYDGDEVVGYTMEHISGETLRKYKGRDLPQETVDEFIEDMKHLATPRTAHRDLFNPRTGEFDLDDVIVETDDLGNPIDLFVIDPLPDYPDELLPFFDLSELESGSMDLLRNHIPTEGKPG